MLQTPLDPESSMAIHRSTAPTYGGNDFNMFTPVDLNTPLISPGEWFSSHARANTSTIDDGSGYFELSSPNHHASKMGYTMNTRTENADSVYSISGLMKKGLDDGAPTYDGFIHSGPLDTTTTAPPPGRRQAPTQPFFTSLNGASTFESPPAYTIEPSQTQLPSLSHSSNTRSSFSTDTASPKTTVHPPSPPVDKRRRISQSSSCDSARAIYLEKNRKAASKCRGKQKRQQEDLVERAREVERKNKALKFEVEILRSNMRDLMEVVGQHTSCKDGRMRAYVEREAEKLVPLAQLGIQTTNTLLEKNGTKS